MISQCVYCGILELNERAFFQDTFVLLAVMSPAALGFTLWRLFVTNKSSPRGGIIVLGLNNSAFLDSGWSLSTYVRLPYLLFSVLTFELGLISSEGFKILHHLIP